MGLDCLFKKKRRKNPKRPRHKSGIHQLAESSGALLMSFCSGIDTRLEVCRISIRDINYVSIGSFTITLQMRPHGS